MPTFNRRLRLAPVCAVFCLAAPLALAGVALAAAPAKDETIVFLRHGEKPDAGLGQLSCKGLNRALALPAMLSQQFGRPDAVFAPDPSKRKDDSGVSYDYVRPLATIEPTAIAAGLPVDTTYGYDEISGLQAALSKPAYRSSLVFVAWEHKQIYDLVAKLLKDNGGNPAAMPEKWKGKDFDGLYVVKIDRSAAKPTATFELKTEGLDGVAEGCPLK